MTGDTLRAKRKRDPRRRGSRRPTLDGADAGALVALAALGSVLAALGWSGRLCLP